MGAAQSNTSQQRPAQNNAPDLTPLVEMSTLSERHEWIRRLFHYVARELETAEHDGRDHPLCQEWSILQRRHDQIFRDSVQNAGVSAGCLQALQKNMTIWQCTSTPEINMKDMVNFNQALEGHRLKAHGIAVRIEQLGEAVKEFRLRTPDFGTRLAHSAVDALDRLLDILLSMIEWVTSRVFGMRGIGYCDACECAHVNTHHNIEGPLSKTVKTWKVLDMKYAYLLDALAAACSVANDPEGFDVHLKAARSSCMVLYECMSAYSTD
ncbi:uncharacterized protein LAESUDRAFT_356384 [Laetiporus sulphureus 93-53]|uniref:Uncharacterized protein n=1 Tax=Laetiporus sulphureus 93-53 TaxID=1314785 RepID=A0A165GWN8_9APHY|nr:uncharacterized protein LAESUDRAFT_356384 [Laetiporus sulphureus 93-53]KZT10928.1 hypothetical protein LAESUDRAFT_356384 [Laetiporus sulphureus 93-53]